jgi:predicted  nucleic acid-binding Zn-ribbon protein
LESLQHELETLDRRISDLEDAEIEVMERLETAETELGDMEANRQALDGEIVTARASRDEVLSGLDADLEQTRSARDKLAADVPPDLLALYERLRANHNGVGAAELSHGRCGGCRLELNQADLRSIAAAAEDDVVRCEECGRILVRTSASGI